MIANIIDSFDHVTDEKVEFQSDDILYSEFISALGGFVLISGRCSNKLLFHLMMP